MNVLYMKLKRLCPTGMFKLCFLFDFLLAIYTRMESTPDGAVRTRDDWVPRLGMEFISENEAYNFYTRYGGRLGFTVRKDYSHKSRTDNTIVTSRKFVCNRQGIRKKDKRDAHIKVHRPETRTNCPARMGIALCKNGLYKVNDFVEEHNHLQHLPATIDMIMKRSPKHPSDSGAETAAEDVGTYEEGPIIEPSVGMEFESEEAAKEFYREYARRVGFMIRNDTCRRSEVDRRLISRRFSCNKEGFYARPKSGVGPTRRPWLGTRAGCKAMILIKVNKSGKWVISRFEKEHTHPLLVPSSLFRVPEDAKDRRIMEVTKELEHENFLCELYREHLLELLRDVEEQSEIITKKVHNTVRSVQQFENGGRRKLRLS